MSHVCRFCKQDRKGDRMFKYAARHWAHYECWLNCKGAGVVRPWEYHGILIMLKMGLHGWQLHQFPVFKLADWLRSHDTKDVPAKTWTDKACWLLKKAIQYAEKEPVKA